MPAGGSRAYIDGDSSGVCAGDDVTECILFLDVGRNCGEAEFFCLVRFICAH
jgi:hypothetical protein